MIEEAIQYAQDYGILKGDVDQARRRRTEEGERAAVSVQKERGTSQTLCGGWSG